MIDDYCEHFALDADPFSQEIFYPAPSQIDALEALIHQLQFGDSAAVLTGGKGSGKSTLLQQLSRKLDQEVYLLVAQDFSSQEQLLQSLAEELLLPVETGMSASALEGLIASLAVEQDPSVAPVILVDDAEQLPQGAMLTLLRLAAPVKTRRALRLVLVCPPGFAEQLPAQVVPVPPMPLDEAVALLNTRLQASGYQGAPLFENARVAPWWQSADGDLSYLQQQAEDWLRERAAAPASAVSSFAAGLPASPVPLGHIIGVALLLGALGTVYIYQRDSSDNTGDTSDSRVVSLPQASRSHESSAQSSSAVLTDSAESSLAAPSDPLEAVPGTALENPQPPLVVETKEQSMEKEIPPPAELPLSEPEVETPSAPAAADSQPLRPAASDLTEDEQEILSWPAAAYTLQLLAVSTRQSAEAFSGRHTDLPLLILETRRQGKPWYVVVTGRYNTPDLARRALLDMPDKVKDAKPWPRQVGELQEEIR